MKIEKIYPVVTADNIFSVIEKLGMKPWPRINEPVALEDYLKLELTEEEKKDLRFLPKYEVATFKDPKGKTFRGFRREEKNGTVVFCPLAGQFLPVCAEFRHGAEIISLNLPGGIIEKDETPLLSAKREFESETGIILQSMVPLSESGEILIARESKSRNFSYIGIPKEPLVIIKQNLDQQEYLKIVLVPISEWLKLIDHDKVENFSVVATFKAIRKLQII